jgi:hypothetical protein
MAEIKISELASATTPLGGTEVVPIVQGGVTKKVAVSNIGGSGGTSLTTAYYFNNVAGGSPYPDLTSIPTNRANSSSIQFAGWNNSSPMIIANNITPIGVPANRIIPGGTWQFNLYFSSTVANKNWGLNAQIYKRDSAGNETLIAAGGLNINNMATTPTLYSWNVTFPETTMLSNDRIVTKLIATNTGVDYQTALFYIEGNATYSWVKTTMNQSVLPTKTINNQPIGGYGNIQILPARTRQIYKTQTSFINIVEMMTAFSPINIDLQCETYGGSGNITLYLSYNNYSVSAGAIQVATYSFTSAVRTFRFKRVISKVFDSGSGEDYWYERGTMYLVKGNHYSDEVPSNHIIESQDYYFVDSNGQITYPTNLVALINYTGVIHNVNIEQGT